MYIQSCSLFYLPSRTYHMHPEFMLVLVLSVHRLTFIHNSDWFPFGPENAKYSIWSWRVQVFAERAVATSPRVRDEVITTWLRRQLVPGTYDRHLVVSLCRLATTVDALLGQYWGFAQGIAHGQVPVLALEAPLGRPGTRSGADFPSRSERHRLVRAFLRYEFMCRMFSIPYWKILTYTAMKKDLSPGQAIARLESFAKNDFNTEGFLLLLEEDDAEKTLSVGAFVRAQWRAILSWARQLFENNAMAASQRLAMAAAETLANSDDEPFPLSFFLDTTMTSDDENTEFNLQYLFGRPQASVTSTSGQVNELEATWIDNVAAGFGLVLLKRFLEADDTTRRVHLQTLVTVVDPSSTALERTTGYKPIFMHTRSFPVLPHNAPNKGKIVLKSKGGDVSSGSNSNKKPAGLDKAKMRSLGYHFWDLSRLEIPPLQGSQGGLVDHPHPAPARACCPRAASPWSCLDLSDRSVHKVREPGQARLGHEVPGEGGENQLAPCPEAGNGLEGGDRRGWILIQQRRFLCLFRRI